MHVVCKQIYFKLDVVIGVVSFLTVQSCTGHLTDFYPYFKKKKSYMYEKVIITTLILQIWMDQNIFAAELYADLINNAAFDFSMEKKATDIWFILSASLKSRALGFMKPKHLFSEKSPPWLTVIFILFLCFVLFLY